jgi:putative ABC transport system ATP-binding protein
MFLLAKNLGKRFTTPGGREIVALDSVIGHNGAGKTTLLEIIRRSILADTGVVTVDGVDIRRSDAQIVSVFQDVAVGVIPSMTALENLAFVYSRQVSYLWSIPGRQYRKRIHRYLEEANLLNRFLAFENTPVCELSGGQRQQLAIAMAMLRNPTVLLLDEFVASLDPHVRQEILVWTRNWILRNQITTVMVTHEHELAESWGDSVLELADGKVVRFGTAERKTLMESDDEVPGVAREAR